MREMNNSDDPVKTVAILTIQSCLVAVPDEQWQRIAEQLSLRLHHPVVVLPMLDDNDERESFQSAIAWYAAQGFQRFVVMPIGLEALDLQALYSVVVWLRAEAIGVRIHVSRSWTEKDWVDAFRPGVVEAITKASALEGGTGRQRKSAMLVITDGESPGDSIGLEAACLAYYFAQSDDRIDVRYAFTSRLAPNLYQSLQKMDIDGVQEVFVLAWHMEAGPIEKAGAEMGWLNATELPIQLSGFAWTWNRMCYGQVRPVALLEHIGWMHVAVSFYLEALATRSIERYFDTRQIDGETDKGKVNYQLMQLDRRVDSILPLEYQGKTDDIDPRSMGSAVLHSDHFGAIAWDEIWTSFCDLAMAGGPPHRGRLLEAVTAEQARSEMSAYERVVKEIRRGIEMVTGLTTIESDVLGWVGLKCDDEAMAVWLMRAIIVENVMVRREGSVLMLPAGPDFQVRKEIKNVITSVAKTVHYWRAHLRLDQDN